MKISIALKKDYVIKISKSLLLTFSIPVLTYLGSILRIYLPFTPVPITFQTYFVLTSAALTQWYISMSGQMLYFIAGIIGIPVFANKLTGLSAILHPTSGYILGFIIASFIVSKMMNKRKNMVNIYLSLILGNLIIYTSGIMRLSLLYGIKNAILIGVVPFIYGDILKIIFASITVKILRGKI